ncbi:MAG: hypothetical protein M3323_02000 [Actinomycetota bacterium]|nr:hypothetical protein [Actinomycetota bacterium]
MKALPFEVREAIIKVCGQAFWYKDPLKSLLLQAGVPVELYDRYGDESKFKIARHVLAELDQFGEPGWRVQRQILDELCRLRGVPDEEANKDVGLAALRWLKELALTHGLRENQQANHQRSRLDEARARQAAVAARAEKTDELKSTFRGMVAAGATDPQRRGMDWRTCSLSYLTSTRSPTDARTRRQRSR